VSARQHRRLTVVSWLFVAVGCLSIAFTLLRLVSTRELHIAVLGLASIPIGLGLRARRDTWRIVALGLGFLGVLIAGFGLLVMLGAPGFDLALLRADGEALPPSTALPVLTGIGCVGGWLAWLLTRPLVLRAFGNA
jgi:hypothetical protein